MRITVGDIRRLIRETLEDDIEETIRDRFEEPEFDSIPEFVAFKVNNDEKTYDLVELHVLARKKMMKARPGVFDLRDRFPTSPSKVIIDEVHWEIYEALETMKDDPKSRVDKRYELNYVPRTPPQTSRGFTSNPHGRHPFAGQGGGGTGFSTSFGGGGGFTSYGGGPGAVGGYVWKSGDKKNLPMGSRRK